MKTTNDIDNYIAGFPHEVQVLLREIRLTILEAAPEAEELISYKMPAYKQNGILVWFAGNKRHIGLYPSAAPIVFFKDELTNYKTSKGAIQFPIDMPLPLELIAKIVKFRVNANIEKMVLKKRQKGKSNE